MSAIKAKPDAGMTRLGAMGSDFSAAHAESPVQMMDAAPASLKGNVCSVTGADGGIGAATH